MKNIIKKYVEAQKRLNSKQNWIDSLYCTGINMAIYTVAICMIAGVNLIVKKVNAKKEAKHLISQYEYYNEMEENKSEEETEE